MGGVTPTVTTALGALNTLAGSPVPGLNQGLAAVNALSGIAGGKDEQRAQLEAQQAQEAAQKAQLQAEQGLALQQLEAKQSEAMQNLQDQTALDRSKLLADAQQTETDRQAALRRAVARQRAQFASQGLDSTGGGSGDAVLLGLFSQSEEEKAQQQKLDDIRNQALDQNVASQNSLNILQREQLLQKQKLEQALQGF